MTALYLVPNAYLRKWRQEATRSGDNFVPLTLPGLVAQILKEGLVSYKEDEILEEVAVWQAVQDHRHTLDFFAPIAHYPGFIQELKWLFRQIDLGEDILQNLPELGEGELVQLHYAYHEILRAQGLLDKPGQIRQALRLTKERQLLPAITSIQIRGLGDLSPLESEFLHSLAQGRPLEEVYATVVQPKIEVIRAPDPNAEVEMIGLAIRQQVKKGVPLDHIGLAFPNPTSYEPILLSVFGKLGIPWRSPSTSLRNTPLGKSVLTLIAGELEGWHKHHLQLLTAPGWGFPFQLSSEEQRHLRLGPPYKGLPAWRQYLGEHAGWKPVLDLLGSLEDRLVTQSVRLYGLWLEELLVHLHPERWVTFEDDLENWAELVKAWDGMETIAQSLQYYEWVCTPKQFLQLLQALVDNFQIRARRVFHEQLPVLSVEHLGAHTYERLYVGGLVEGQFPPHKHAHWLTKTRTEMQTEQLYERLVGSASQVYLYYPEIDMDGKLNLPSNVLPRLKDDPKREASIAVHRPSLYLGEGFLQDPELLTTLKERILKDGLSTSQLNRYANCPYQFFCSYVLELQPQEEASLELDARDRGIILHNVLQEFWSNYLEGPVPTVDVAQAELEGLVREEYFARGETPAPKLIRSLRWFVRQDLERVESGFRPRFLERWFQGLNIETSAGPVQIRGQIDRIDVSPQGEYVLYDYKTGTTPSVQDILRGKDLQIAIYLLAAQSILPDARNVGVAYYALQDAKLVGVFHMDSHRDLMVRKGRGCLEDEEFTGLISIFEKIIQTYLEGIFRGDFPIEPASSQICRFCPFQGICRKEVGV